MVMLLIAEESLMILWLIADHENGFFKGVRDE